MNIRFEALDGRYFQFSASRETVKAKSIKPLLEDVFDIPAQEQELIYQDTTSQLLLHEEAILYHNYDKTVLVRPKAREVKIRLYIYPEKTDTEIVCNTTEPLSSLKNKIHNQLGVPMDKKLFSFHGRECADHETLRYYHVFHNDDLLLWEPPSQGMTVFVKTLTGKTMEIDIHPNDLVYDLMTKIEDREGIPPDEQRIIFAGRQLESQKRLFQYNIGPDSTVHLVLRLRGMISSFSFTDMNDPLVRYLMLPETERQKTVFPLETLLQLQGRLRSLPNDSFFFNADCGILSQAHRGVIGKFLDFMWSKNMENGETSVDMKVVLPGDILVQLLLPFAARSSNQHVQHISPEEVLDRLTQVFDCNDCIGRGSLKIALRMTKGPTNACINFHQDGSYATYTMQLALNDPEEYEGGKLCYFVKNRLHALTRHAGSLVGHAPPTIHGVTALTGGVRKSLFLVNQSNGLGERDIINTTPGDVTAFWDSDFSNLCAYCFVKFPDQNCSGCQKKSMCTDCTQTFVDCPQCRIVQMVDSGKIKSKSRKRKIEAAS